MESRRQDPRILVTESMNTIVTIVMSTEAERAVKRKESEMRITHLKRREIQAPIIASFIKGFAEEIGYDKAIAIAEKVIRDDAISSGKKLARGLAKNTLSELSKIVTEVWAEDGAMRIEMIRQSDNELFFDVTYCAYAEMYQKMGIRELGFILSCSRDVPFIEGFNPELELRRTKTLMDGADCCDFRYAK